ncbi:hypothetical protein D0Z67_29475 (plasmid) [Streptomyces seoulensis]|uniref:4Fe-4S Wbl-type domain-containing protein n=1 Tax=Streptomyces seoulensis TaxID=73044 RepID=A0A4P6U5J3_STRSO|nr:WhiB family transcriptional regulator [Streptomyces seoulensis]QBJ94501.1 hypothetical protein D0Z67_29475 [Streptomyces seoulensis]
MAGDTRLPVGAHHGPDAFEAEGQRERLEREAAAIAVCVACPVMVQCDAYASSVTVDGKLAEPDGVWGGRRSLERHRALVKRRVATVAAPRAAFGTAQKRAVLAALAVVWEPFQVAREASRLLAVWGEGPAGGVDVRTANWQRSQLVRLLGLPKDVTRMRALAVARERGLLEGVVVVADDGTVPAVPPPTKVPPVAVLPVPRPRRTPTSRPRRPQVRVMPGQVPVLPGQLSFESLIPSNLGAAA